MAIQANITFSICFVSKSHNLILLPADKRQLPKGLTQMELTPCLSAFHLLKKQLLSNVMLRETSQVSYNIVIKVYVSVALKTSMMSNDYDINAMGKIKREQENVLALRTELLV